MRIFGSYTLPFDLEKTYQNLHDPAIAARCVDGCEAFEKLADDEYAMTVKMALGGFSVLFSGKLKIYDANPPRSFKMLVEGGGTAGSLKGEGLMSLAPAQEATELTYDGDVQVSGGIASLGQRAIDSTAKAMIRRFFERFVEEVGPRG